MKNEIMRFVNEKFGEIRGVEIDGEPWLVGKDIAKVLGYSDPSGAILKHVDSEDKNFVMLATVTDSQNGNVPISKSKTAIINESGFYSLIMSSKLPEAKPVFAWIREELENYKEQKKQALALPKEANNVQLFENREFGRMRSITINGEPWFVAKDVCDILCYTNSRKALIDHVDDEDKNTVTIRYGTSGNPNQIIINESGLYSLIMSSKLENAKKFKRWVTHEVLPAIRKTGGYINPNSINNDEFAYRTIDMLVDKIYLLGQKNKELEIKMARRERDRKRYEDKKMDKSQIEDEEVIKAYNMLLKLINNNKDKFTGNNTDEIWGKVDTNEGYYLINKNICVNELAKAGFDFNSVKTEFARRGYLERNTQDKFAHYTKVFNKKASYIKILFDPEELEQDEDLRPATDEVLDNLF